MTQQSASQIASAEGDRLARRNAVVLSASMALAGANAAVVISTGSLVGKLLAPSPALATLPHYASPVGGPMGAWQPAAAGPTCEAVSA